MEPHIDKSKVNVTIYEINKNTCFYTYTATWCGPCKRIKPKVIEIMSKLGHKVLNQEIIEKTFFKENINEFVPFFVVKSDEKTDSIQTSDELLLKQFLSKNAISMLVLDDDF